MKRCPDCGETKPRDQWPKNRSNMDGLQSYCKPCYNERIRGYADRAHGSRRNFLLKLRYGIDERAFAALVESQGGVCAICGGEPKHVDHDHTSGRVRGILCFTCNNGLGKFGDEPILIEAAAHYLEAAGGPPPSVGDDLGLPDGEEP